MMKNIILIFALVVAEASLGNECHTFTTQEGQTVTAKIIAISSYTGKVKLERENGRKVWVEIDIFTREDQSFIHAWRKKASMPKTPKPKEPAEEEPEGTEEKTLSKTDIRNIAKQYKKAWERHDYVLWSSLLNIHKGHHLLNERTFKDHDVKSVALRAVEGRNILMEYNLEVGKNEETEKSGTVGLVEEHHGWLQILPDGKIKYTPIVFQHPMYTAMDSLYIMFPFLIWEDTILIEERLRIIQDSVNNLERMGIPCFGYDLKSSDSKRNDSFELILDWMIDNCDSWDETEPKIVCPEDMFKAKLLRIKKIK